MTIEQETKKEKKSILKTGWGVILGLVAVLTIAGICLGALTGLDSRYAIAADTDKIHNAQIDAIGQIQKQMVIDRNQMNSLWLRQQEQLKLNGLTDRKYRLKDLIKKYPTDEEIKEDYKDVVDQIKALNSLLSKPISLSAVMN